MLLNGKKSVTNILGCYDSYDIARLKLKDAEMHIDIATDPETRGKGKRRKKSTYRYSYDTDAEDNILKKKIPKQRLYKKKRNLSLPEPPKLTQFKCTTSRGKENTRITVEPCCSSKEQLTHIAEDKNTFTPRIEPGKMTEMFLS